MKLTVSYAALQIVIQKYSESNLPVTKDGMESIIGVKRKKPHQFKGCADDEAWSRGSR